MIGTHMVKSWSSTQKVVALSSGEAELIAVVKMSTEILGVLNLYREWGLSKGARVFADSSAALGVVHRKGSGKLRHIKVSTLWVQDKRESGDIQYQKVEGSLNPGDLMTKHLGAKIIQRHSKAVSLEVREGRAEASLRTG